MLERKWNPNNGNASKKCKNQMNTGHIKASQDDPEDIEKQVKTSIAGLVKIDTLAKGCQRKNPQFDELNSKGYPNDRKANNDPANYIENEKENASPQYHP